MIDVGNSPSILVTSLLDRDEIWALELQRREREGRTRGGKGERD